MAGRVGVHAFFTMTLSEAPAGAGLAVMGTMPGMAGMVGVSYRSCMRPAG